MITRDCKLPNVDFDLAWESIHIDPAQKRLLVGQAVLSLQVRGRLPFPVAPLHGLILLTGPPGTGKTTLAQGLANKVAAALPDLSVRFIQVDPHALASSALGNSQQQVTRHFQQVIPEATDGGASIVLLDEVETLAISRHQLSMDANPIDVHRVGSSNLPRPIGWRSLNQGPPAPQAGRRGHPQDLHTDPRRYSLVSSSQLGR